MSSSAGGPSSDEQDRIEAELRLKLKVLASMAARKRTPTHSNGSSSPKTPSTPSTPSAITCHTSDTVHTVGNSSLSSTSTAIAGEHSNGGHDAAEPSNGANANGANAANCANGANANAASTTPVSDDVKKKRSRWSSIDPPVVPAVVSQPAIESSVAESDGKLKKRSRWGVDDPPRASPPSITQQAVAALQQAATRPMVPGLPALPASLLPLLMAAATGNKEMLTAMVMTLPTAPPPVASATDNGLSPILPAMSNTQLQTMLLMPPSTPINVAPPSPAPSPSASPSSSPIILSSPTSSAIDSASSSTPTTESSSSTGSSDGTVVPKRRNRWADAEPGTTPSSMASSSASSTMVSESASSSTSMGSLVSVSTSVTTSTTMSTALVAIGKTIDYSHIAATEPGAVALMALAMSDADQGGSVSTQLTLPGGGAKYMRPHTKRDVLVERGMVIGMTGSPSDKESPATVTPFVPTAENITELITLRNRLEVCLYKLTNLAAILADPTGARSPSPEPTYDDQGRRTNTREVRTRSKLNKERIELTDRLGKLDPSYRAPPPEVPSELRGKKWKKIFLKNARDGDNNWIGLIIGPRGNTQKRLEKECGCRIAVRGRGSHKDGRARRRADGSLFGGEEEELHILVTAGSDEDLERGVRAVEVILSDPGDGAPDHKSASLRELAMLNGTWRDDPICRCCGAKGHLMMECPDRQSSWQRARVKCETCGSENHPTWDCTKPPEVLKSQQTAEADYDAFMNELSSDAPLSASVMAVAQPKLLTGPAADTANNTSNDTPTSSTDTAAATTTASIPSVVASLPAMRGPYMGGMQPMMAMGMPMAMMPMMHPSGMMHMMPHPMHMMPYGYPHMSYPAYPPQ